MKILVVGATGHVGSQVVKILAEKGHDIRALVRRESDTVHGAPNSVEYVLGDLRDKRSLEKALKDIDAVVSTANTIIPVGKNYSVKALNDKGYENLISAAEAAGVKQIVQSSVPKHIIESKVPELNGKRAIEARLERSPIAHSIIRNPAFLDVWLVMCGVKQLMGPDPHATTRRPYGFMRLWQKLTGNFVKNWGIFLAPGGADHGSVFVTTKDVAHMMAAMVGREDAYNKTFEAGGPEWLSWRDVANIISQKTGKKIRIIPVPAWLASKNAILMKPFMMH